MHKNGEAFLPFDLVLVLYTTTCVICLAAGQHGGAANGTDHCQSTEHHQEQMRGHQIRPLLRLFRVWLLAVVARYLHQLQRLQISLSIFYRLVVLHYVQQRIEELGVLSLDPQC